MPSCAGSGRTRRSSFHNYGAKTAPVPIGSLRAIAQGGASPDAAGSPSGSPGFDLVVDTRAGDSFASIYGLDRHAAMSASAEYAHRCGVPVVLGPQTIGPFESRIVPPDRPPIADAPPRW